MCLKNAHRAENASFGICAARLFRAIEHRYSQKKDTSPEPKNCIFISGSIFQTHSSEKIRTKVNANPELGQPKFNFTRILLFGIILRALVAAAPRTTQSQLQRSHCKNQSPWLAEFSSLYQPFSAVWGERLPPPNPLK